MIEQPKNSTLYFVLSLCIVFVATLTPGNGKILGDILDKVVHYFIFFFLALTTLYRFQKTSFLFWCILLGLATEVLQQFISGRNMDMYDAIADTLGVISGYYVFYNKK